MIEPCRLPPGVGPSRPVPAPLLLSGGVLSLCLSHTFLIVLTVVLPYIPVKSGKFTEREAFLKPHYHTTIRPNEESPSSFSVRYGVVTFHGHHKIQIETRHAPETLHPPCKWVVAEFVVRAEEMVKY